MSQYILVLVWLMILYFVSRQSDQLYERVKLPSGDAWRLKKGFALVAVAPLIYWTATRSYRFADTRAYVRAFRELPTALSQIRPYLATVGKDKGFTVFSILIKILVGGRVAWYLAIIAAIQIIILIMIFRKYSCNMMISLFLFVASTDYISWMHNGIRQFLAVTLIFAGSGFLFRKKYLPFLLLILLAATFHLSALLMIPIALVSHERPWRLRTFLMIGAVIFLAVYITQATRLLDDVLVETQYSNVVTEWQESTDDGTNPIRVLVYSIPAILSFVGLKRIREAADPVITVACNMSIMTMLLYVISMFTSGIFAGRLPIYCSLYAMGILLPWEIENMFSYESSKITKVLMFTLFLGFYYYQMHVAWGVF